MDVNFIESVIHYVKAFNGEVIGGYVRDRYAGVNGIKDIDCRIEQDHLFNLLNVLSVNYTVIDNPMSVNYKRFNVCSYFVCPKRPAAIGPAIKLDLFCCSFAKWHIYPCDFDVNLLAANNDSLFVRPNTCNTLKQLPDRLNVILDRCKQRHFALVALPSQSTQDILTLILRSKSLVGRGWIMDDKYLGEMSFIMNKWSNLACSPETKRTTHSASQKSAMVSQTDCAICHEAFGEDDIVMNTCCNHNFHWECHSRSVPANAPAEQAGGIYNWFVTKGCFQCPNCRQSAVQFSFI
jgi:hypothetical protein